MGQLGRVGRQTGLGKGGLFGYFFSLYGQVDGHIGGPVVRQVEG